MVEMNRTCTVKLTKSFSNEYQSEEFYGIVSRKGETNGSDVRRDVGGLLGLIIERCVEGNCVGEDRDWGTRDKIMNVIRMKRLKENQITDNSGELLQTDFGVAYMKKKNLIKRFRVKMFHKKKKNT